MKISIELTKVQESALIQFAIIRIIEDRLEHEVDAYIARKHAAEKASNADLKGGTIKL